MCRVYLVCVEVLTCVGPHHSLFELQFCVGPTPFLCRGAGLCRVHYSSNIVLKTT